MPCAWHKFLAHKDMGLALSGVVLGRPVGPWVWPRQLCGEGFEWLTLLSLKVLVWAGLA